MASAASSRLAKQGWLTKRGHMRKTWKRRWMVLDPDHQLMSYHVSNDNLLSPKGIIQLANASLVSLEECLKLFQIELCFGIRTTSGKVYYMFAENAKECSEWMRSVMYIARGGSIVQQKAESPLLERKSSFQQLSDKVQGGRTRLASSSGRTRFKPWSELWEEGVKPKDSEIVNLTARFKRLRDKKAKGKGNDLERLKTRVIKMVDSATSDGDYLVTRKPGRNAKSCPHCKRDFQLLSTRRAFCELCGDAVCTRSGCSDPVELSELTTQMGIDDRGADLSGVVKRVCTKCERTALSVGAQSKIKSQDKSRLELLYDEMCERQTKADSLLPRFNEVVGILKRSSDKPQHLIDEAKRLRIEVKAILDSVVALGGKIEKLPNAGDGQKKQVLQNIRLAATQWFQARSFTLQSLSVESV